MLDINLIRERTEWVKEQIAKLNDTAPVDEIVALDERRRAILQEVEELRRRRNEASKQIGRWMGSLRKLEADIEAARYDGMELPVKLRVHDSVFVPLAKWSMLLAGNYRCVTKQGPRSIKEAVHSDIAASRAVYEWVFKLCVSLGADPKDLVPFEKYAAAAQGLASPSSAARALYAGAPNIERVDRLVKTIAAGKGMRLAAVDETVELVDAKLEENRRNAAAAAKSKPVQAA